MIHNAIKFFIPRHHHSPSEDLLASILEAFFLQRLRLHTLLAFTRTATSASVGASLAQRRSLKDSIDFAGTRKE